MEEKTEEEFCEYYTTEIANFLKEKGYEISDMVGIRLDKPLPFVIGILEPRGYYNLFGLKIRRRASHIGTLWLDNYIKGAKPDSKWVLSVYGKDSLNKLSEILEDFPKPYYVKIKINLESLKPREEIRWYIF